MNENSEDLLVWMFWSRAMSVRAQFSVHQVVRLESREGYRRSSPKQVFLKVYEKKCSNFHRAGNVCAAMR